MKQIGRTLSIALLASLIAGSAAAATISDLRGGVKDTRARLVMDIDETLHYEERAQGRTLTLTFDAKTDRTRSVKVRDRRVKNAVLSPLGKKSRLVVTFRESVPNYKVFFLKKPGRLVIDFPTESKSSSSGSRKKRESTSAKG